jgi:hypothetical protein
MCYGFNYYFAIVNQSRTNFDIGKTLISFIPPQKLPGPDSTIPWAPEDYLSILFNGILSQFPKFRPFSP